MSAHIGEKLVSGIPELEPTYHKLLESWEGEDPGLHVLVGDLLNPYLEKALTEGRTEDAQRALGFVEEMARSPDERVVNVVYVTICEYIVLDDTLKERAEPLLGPETARICKEMAEWWARFREDEGRQD